MSNLYLHEIICIETTPKMYLREKKLSLMSSYLSGFRFAINHFGDYSGTAFHTAFTDFVRDHYNESGVWDADGYVMQHSASEEEAFAEYFRLFHLFLKQDCAQQLIAESAHSLQSRPKTPGVVYEIRWPGQERIGTVLSEWPVFLLARRTGPDRLQYVLASHLFIAICRQIKSLQKEALPLPKYDLPPTPEPFCRQLAEKHIPVRGWFSFDITPIEGTVTQADDDGFTFLPISGGPPQKYTYAQLSCLEWEADDGILFSEEPMLS